MTTVQLNNGLTLFPSQPTSYFQSLKQRLWTGLPSTLLLHELNSQDSLSYPTFLKVVAFLADHPHSRLEQALKEKLSKETPSTALYYTQSASMDSLLYGHLKMLDVCKRIVSLDQLKSGLGIENVKALAENEALVIPKPPRKIQKLSDKLIQHWQKCTYVFGKVINVFYVIITGTFIYIAAILLSILTDPPRNIFQVVAYFSNYREMVLDLLNQPKNFLEYFPTTETAAKVGVGIVILSIAIYYIHKQLHLGVPEEIDKKGYFKNTSLEAHLGKITKMKGRLPEKEKVITAWNVPQGEKFRIALLVGPTGCGKTEFVKGLAWESIYDPDSFVYRKTIFTINTVKLMNEKSDYLERALDNIAGYEDDVVLFFDEGHTAGSQKGTIGPLIELLKTTILDRNIRCIFGTTNKEFNDNIAHNEAFVDRCTKVDFEELPDADSKKILKDKVELDQNRLIEVDADAYDALLHVARHHPKYSKRSNPRKIIDLYKDVRSDVLGWAPKTLNEKFGRLTTERDELKATCLTANNDANWSNSPDGIAKLRELQDKEQEVLDLTAEIKKQTLELRKIAYLRSLQPQYRQRYNELVHQLTQETSSDDLHKEFLYLKHILTTALQATLESEVKRLSTTYQEELPLKIDATLIRKLYKSKRQKIARERSASI